MLAAELAETGGISNQQFILATVATIIGLLVMVIAGLMLNRQYLNSREKTADGLTGVRSIDVTFARLVGLIAIAVLGLVGLCLGLAVQSETVSAFFTLLGGIAGYLVGAKTSESSSKSTETDEQGNTVIKEQTTPQLG